LVSVSHTQRWMFHGQTDELPHWPVHITIAHHAHAGYTILGIGGWIEITNLFDLGLVFMQCYTSDKN
jgi:hypothetical protein